jgi:hypothetical protein
VAEVAEAEGWLMAAQFSVTGVDQLNNLHKALKGWDDELRKQMSKDLAKAAKPVIPEVRAVLAEEYPKRGGLAAEMAKAPMTTRYFSGRNPGVRLVVRGLQIKLGEVYGKLRHPVFADKANQTRDEWRWVEQAIPGDVIAKRVSKSLGLVVPGISKILENTAQAVLDRGTRR